MLNRRAFHAGCLTAAAGLLLPARADAQFKAPEVTAATPSLPSRPKDLASSQARLALRMIDGLSRGGEAGQDGDTNVVVSPIGLALTMSVVGLLGPVQMRDSLSRALELPGDGMASLEDLLGKGKGLIEPRRGTESPLTAANLLMLDRTAEPFAFTLDGLKGRGIELTEDDLGGPEVVTHANAWSASHTNGLVPKILDAPPGRGGLVALNALHFKDVWKVPFDTARSMDGAFHGHDNKKTTVRMMEGNGTYLLRTGRGRAAIDLPFRDSRFSLVLAARTDKVTDAASLVRDVGAWTDGIGFLETAAEVRIPRLELSGSTDLLALLGRLGMINQPLTGLGTNAPTLRAVAQRTVLKMDEHGAEAAATTAASASRSLAIEVAKVTFDKPFLFSLRERETGFVVMAGYVGHVPRNT